MSQSYQVLARTYRPKSFADNFLGQDVTLRVLSQAIRCGKVPHAILLSGIRGIGKTTTARIIARTLNCHKLDYVKDLPTPCLTCPSCQSLDEDNSLDVMEVDAASRTGVDDIRDILGSLPYKPSLGRYRIFIIDEVHMLSKSAFNALLKSLEEPPSHVIFIFATTEVAKIPTTILSRCMRFDLRPFTKTELTKHLEAIFARESIAMEPDGLHLLVEAAKGSARDALSLADQARHLSNKQNDDGVITAQQIRHLLGKAEKRQIIQLMDKILRGQVAAVLDLVQDLYAQGIAPAEIAVSILDLLYLTSREVIARQMPASGGQRSFVKEEGDEAAPVRSDAQTIVNDAKDTFELGIPSWTSLTIPLLQTLWHVVTKGYEDIRRSPLPEAALEMLLIRVMHVHHKSGSQSDTPSAPQGIPSNIIPEQKPSPETPREPTAAVAPQTTIQISSLEDIVNLAHDHREPLIASHLVQDVHLVDLGPGRLILKLTDHAPRDFGQTLQAKLRNWTGEPWVVSQSTKSIPPDELPPTLQDQQLKTLENLQREVLQDPLVQGVLKAFPGSEVVKVEPLRHTDPAQ